MIEIAEGQVLGPEPVIGFIFRQGGHAGGDEASDRDDGDQSEQAAQVMGLLRRMGLPFEREDVGDHHASMAPVR